MLEGVEDTLVVMCFFNWNKKIYNKIGGRLTKVDFSPTSALREQDSLTFGHTMSDSLPFPYSLVLSNQRETMQNRERRDYRSQVKEQLGRGLESSGRAILLQSNKRCTTAEQQKEFSIKTWI